MAITDDDDYGGQLDDTTDSGWKMLMHAVHANRRVESEEYGPLSVYAQNVGPSSKNC